MAKEITNETIVERIEGIKTHINTKFDENKKEHKTLDENQKQTNGKVQRLQLWKAGIIGMFSVISVIIVPISIYILDDWKAGNTIDNELNKRVSAMEELLEDAEIIIE